MPEELKGVNLDEPEEDNEDGSLEKTGKLFMNIMLIAFIALFIGLAISAEDVNSRRNCIILSILLIIVFIKLNWKNKTRRIQ